MLKLKRGLCQSSSQVNLSSGLQPTDWPLWFSSLWKPHLTEVLTPRTQNNPSQVLFLVSQAPASMTAHIGSWGPDPTETKITHPQSLLLEPQALLCIKWPWKSVQRYHQERVNLDHILSYLTWSSMIMQSNLPWHNSDVNRYRRIREYCKQIFATTITNCTA